MKARFNKKLYTKSGLNVAMEAFDALCKIKLDADSTHYTLDFQDPDPSVEDVLVDEFSNYALYAVISGKKQW